MKTLINITTNKWAEDIAQAINSTNIQNNRYVTFETDNAPERFVHALIKTDKSLPLIDTNLTVIVSDLNGVLARVRMPHTSVHLQPSDKMYLNT